ncbi:MAG: hypothetical protein IT369_23130 [Candidatus Latescibacteria bacterium]|nr:hypothetical protein [Candidatus Latescibacterota bacterium]
MGEVIWRTAAAPWATDQGLGNHRAVVRVAAAAPAVRVQLPWRRHDSEPQRKAVLVAEARGGAPLANVAVLRVSAEVGELVFEPEGGPGEYHVYYLPQRQEGWQHGPTTVYAAPQPTAAPAWLASLGLVEGKTAPAIGLPEAELIAFEAIDDFHRFDPMELVATSAEVAAFLARFSGRDWLVFAEDRRFPVRLRRHLPWRWVQEGVSASFAGCACRGEFYALQVVVYAPRRPLGEVRLEFGDLQDPAGARIPASALRCLNLGGRDWLGAAFAKGVEVAAGQVQPLWVGVAVAADATPGTYRGQLCVAAEGVEAQVLDLALEVTGETLEDGGDGELWRHTRLAWLDSTLGIDAETVDPYPPLTQQGRRLELLGRSVELGAEGLPAAIITRYDASVQHTGAPGQELLASPLRFVAVVGGRAEDFAGGDCQPQFEGSGRASWQVQDAGPHLERRVQATLESDGYLTYRVVLRARAAVDLDDVRLEIPLRPAFARYQMGMGKQGGRRTGDWHWTWSEARANHMVWLGDVHGGLQCKLMYERDIWELYSLAGHGLPPAWHNEGRGGCRIEEIGATEVRLTAFSGSRHLAAGEELVFRFGLLITPFHPLDRDHWQWRYYGDGLDTLRPVPEVAAEGARIRHLHHGNELNPHINYPFVRAEELADYTREVHAHQMRLIMYYTVRELSNHAAELWALRSLGDEIYRETAGFHLADHFVEGEKQVLPLAGSGGSWLWEHLGEDFAPAWHHPLGEGRQDAALATQGLSRLHNYYIEGLGWLVRRLGIDGIYLDGIGYDRQIMKRVRKVLKRARRDTLVNFHSGNNFDERYGLNSPAVQYLEHLPYCDSVWFGEGYDYNAAPDAWLIEMSGIPFGLSGEMLQGGGNLWRGMLFYGMANRLGWGREAQPQALWRYWDSCGIAGLTMCGWWDPACPVRSDCGQVPVTVYAGGGRALLALASWAPAQVDCRLQIDWEALGVAPGAPLRAAAIEGFQEEGRFAADAAIPVMPGRGWLLQLG